VVPDAKAPIGSPQKLDSWEAGSIAAQHGMQLPLALIPTKASLWAGRACLPQHGGGHGSAPTAGMAQHQQPTATHADRVNPSREGLDAGPHVPKLTEPAVALV
jgi:hypothetical protein